MSTYTEPQQQPRRLTVAAPPTTPSNRSRTWLRLSLLAGVVLLTASLVGASHVLSSHPASDATNGKAGSERSFSGPPGVFFLGTVDLLNVPGGFVPLSPLQPGQVVDVPVTDVQSVKKGEVLLKVDNEMQAQTVAQAETGVRLAQTQLALAQQAVASYQAGIDAQKAAVDAAQHKIAAADYRLKRQKYLLGLASPMSNQDEINAATEDLDSAKSAVAAEEAKLRAFQANNPDVKVREAQDNLTLARQRVEQARSAMKRCTLEAPADGTVLRVTVSPGAVLGPQSRQAPVIFAPNGSLIVRGELEQEFAHRVQVGMTAVITDEANGQVSWQGRVKQLGAAYLPRRSVGGPESFALAGSDTRVLECQVEIDPGQPMPLLGQRVRVSVGAHGNP